MLNNYKKVIALNLTLLFILIFLSSCKDEDKITKPDSKLSGLITAPFDADFILSTKVWDEYWHYSSDTLTDHRNYFQAILSDGFQLVNADSVSNQLISLNFSIDGHYDTDVMDEDVYPLSGTYTWNIKNFLGSDATLIQTLVPRLKVLSPLKTDTVSKSGFTISYSGNVFADEARLLLYQANSINQEMGISTALDPVLPNITIDFTDAGFINVSSGYLASLIPNRYYQFNIRHANYDSTNHAGKIGVLYSSASVSQYVFITN